MFFKYRSSGRSIPVPIIAHSDEVVLTVKMVAMILDKIKNNDPIKWNDPVGKKLNAMINSTPE